VRSARRTASALVLTLAFSTITFNAKAAENSAVTELPRIRSCEFEPSLNCIVSIKGILPDGSELIAKPTGRTEIGDFKWGETSKVTGIADEWEFPKVKFQSGTGKFTLNAFYFPDGVKHCWADGQCSSRQEQLNFYAVASNFGGTGPMLKLSGKKAEQWCPTNPNECTIATGIRFDSEMKWIVTFSFKNNFIPTITTGRVKNLRVAYDNVDKNKLTIEFVPLVLEHVPYDIGDVWKYEEAFYRNDQAILWIQGIKHDNVQSLGKCSLSGGLQVVSNAIGMGFPTWNKQNQTVDVWVKSPHFDVDGKPLKGYLEVRIPIEMAKCLWNIDLNGEISGKVSITYADSTTPEILTVTGTVTGKDYLMVSTGYHYSSPTIAIQVKNKVAASTKAATKISKKSITCKKGAKVKTLTAIAPKCPTGYKKVA
jgi:hypothetical protein